MGNSDIEFPKAIIDGQELVFPTAEGWASLRANPSLNGVLIAVPDVTLAKVEWLSSVSEIRVGLGLIQFAQKSIWFPYEILSLNGGEYRVHTEALECPACNWRGLTATASLLDCYIGCPNAEELRKRGYALPVVPCPNCGGKLPPRCPVWAKFEALGEA
jgi:hypothetical protein